MNSDLRFQITEKLTGNCLIRNCIDYSNKNIELNLTWGSNIDSIIPYYKQSKEFIFKIIKGTIKVENLFDGNILNCIGIITIDYLHNHDIGYCLWFEYKNKPYRFSGKKVNIRWYNLPTSHTTCCYNICCIDDSAQELIAEGTVYFKLNSIIPFLKSFKISSRGNI